MNLRRSKNEKYNASREKLRADIKSFMPNFEKINTFWRVTFWLI